MVTRRLIPLGVLLLAPAAAEARETITAGLKAGVGLSQPFSDLGTGPELELEGGYALPWVGHRLRALLQIGYERTGSSKTVDDARFPGMKYSFDLHEDELMIMPAIFGQWFSPGERRWTPYAALGPRIFMLRTKVDGQGGTTAPEGFGTSTEENTKVGFALQLGAEFTLWKGALLGELQIQWSKLDHRTTGDTNTGSLGINVGYRLMF
jgi:opacity protein-like surface antigen